MGRLVVIATVAAIAGVMATVSSVAEASTKFSSTEEITGNDLVLNFEEGSLKRFASVDYQLDATALQRWEDCGGQSGVLIYDASDTVALTPDDKGRVVGTLTLESPPGGFLCAPQHVEYTGVTLTNLTTGHVYRLDPISRDSP
jgi:hypothetical protein